MTNIHSKNLVVLTGAGMSAESGIPTYRGPGGLWNGQRLEDLASPQAWRRHPEVVLEFYNQRRKQILQAQPNRGHEILAELEQYFNVTIITQNVDDLHERAGSRHVLHLHGLITQARSSVDDEYVTDIDGWELKLGDLCPRGAQLRPNVVWFGEPVPMIDPAIEICRIADCFVILGTSLLVYPAAGLIRAPEPCIPKFLIDPNAPDISDLENLVVIPEPAVRGLELLQRQLLEKFAS